MVRTKAYEGESEYWEEEPQHLTTQKFTLRLCLIVIILTSCVIFFLLQSPVSPLPSANTPNYDISIVVNKFVANNNFDEHTESKTEEKINYQRLNEPAKQPEVGPLLDTTLLDTTLLDTTKSKRNLMFVKTHKCGTSTLVDVFYLFGARRRWNFVMHPYSHILFFNFPSLEKPLLPPRPGEVYNMQCQHGTFVPGVEHDLLPKDTTLYSTIVRSPVSHFQSAFAFFGAMGKEAKKMDKEASLDEIVNHYLDNFDIDNHGAILNRALNSAALDLGYKAFAARHGTGTLQDKIDAFIAHLDKEIDYVMITDRMDESLVVLKEYLGWNMTDILYLNRMVSGKKKEVMSEATQQRVLKYQVIDRQIFEHFNASFQQHVDNIGREKVSAMVKEFREMRETFENKCFDKSKEIRGPYHSVTWAISDYGKTKNLACTFLQTRDVTLTKVMTELQLSQDYTVPIKGKKEPYLMQSIVTKIQRDYDNNEDLV